MKKIDVYFLLLAALMLLGGVLLGIHMATSRDYQLMPVHAHTNLVGWASLALFGLTYRAFPELKATRLAQVHFAVSGAAAVLMPFGIYRAVVLQSEPLAIVASITWLVGVLLFLAQVIRLVRAPAE